MVQFTGMPRCVAFIASCCSSQFRWYLVGSLISIEYPDWVFKPRNRKYGLLELEALFRAGNISTSYSTIRWNPELTTTGRLIAANGFRSMEDSHAMAFPKKCPLISNFGLCPLELIHLPQPCSWPWEPISSASPSSSHQHWFFSRTRTHKRNRLRKKCY